MKAHQTDFSHGGVYGNIIQVMLPMMVAQLLNLLYNIVDRMYIGQMKGVGTQALSGLGAATAKRQNGSCVILFGCCFCWESA